MHSATQLPPAWMPDPELKQLLPDTHDWRSFCRLRENPARYLVCINGSGIWDLHDDRFITPTIIKGRARYHIALGPNAKPLRLFYSRIIASLVFPASHQLNSQGHHTRRTIEGDGWENLRWQSPKQNRDVETARQQATTRKAKPTDRRHKLDHAGLCMLISRYDGLKRRHQDPNLPRLARFFKISLRQTQRIVAGKTRADEVAAIRKRQAAEAAAAAAAPNPFLDDDDTPTATTHHTRDQNSLEHLQQLRSRESKSREALNTNKKPQR